MQSILFVLAPNWNNCQLACIILSCAPLDSTAAPLQSTGSVAPWFWCLQLKLCMAQASTVVRHCKWLQIVVLCIIVKEMKHWKGLAELIFTNPRRCFGLCYIAYVLSVLNVYGQRDGLLWPVCGRNVMYGYKGAVKKIKQAAGTVAK